MDGVTRDFQVTSHPRFPNTSGQHSGLGAEWQEYLDFLLTVFLSIQEPQPTHSYKELSGTLLHRLAVGCTQPLQDCKP